MGAGLPEVKIRAKSVGFGWTGRREARTVARSGAVAHKALNFSGLGSPMFTLEIGSDERMDIHRLARLQAEAWRFQPELVGEGGGGT